MAFLDEEESLEAPEEFPDPTGEEPLAPRPPRGGRTPRQQIMMRRLVAVGGAVLLLILIVVAFRGCLEARKDRAIRNFVSDIGTLMGESEQVGTDFFTLLNDSQGKSEVEYEAQVKSYRGASETIYDRARGLDAPDELSEAKSAIVTTLQMRRNAMTAIGDSIGQALAAKESTDAQQTISEQMKLLYSSDQVCTGVAFPEIARVTREEDVTGDAEFSAQQCKFVADPAEEWLDLTAVSEALGQVTGDEAVTAGIHGLEINMTSIGDTQLLPDTDVTVSAADPSLTVEILNGGDTDEQDITVTITVDGTELPAQGIPTIPAGETQTLENIPISPVPASGEQATIEVSVDPVPGEEDPTNNTSTYTVIFE